MERDYQNQQAFTTDQSGEEPHARAGQFCPTCDTCHCTQDREDAGQGHEWNDNQFCVFCGADGSV